jgi:P4 family phage/plasmid primase-like protien
MPASYGVRLVDNFLTKYQANGGEPFNYTLLTPPFGRLRIPDEPDHIRELHEFIGTCMDEGVEVGICECHDDELDEPIYMDLDISLSSPVAEEDVSVMEGFLALTNNVLRSMFVVNDDDLVAYVMRRKGVVCEDKNGSLHMGIHVMYPHVRARSALRLMVHHRVVKEMKKANPFSVYPLASDDIVDERVVRVNPILKYGCNKPSKAPYMVDRVYDASLKLLPKPSFSEACMLMSIRINAFSDVPFCTEIKKGVDVDKFLLDMETRIQQQQQSHTSKRKSINREVTQETMERVQTLMGMLSRDRAADRTSWIQVGLCLHNISDSEEMYNLWTEWSQAGCPSKAGRTNFRQEWRRFRQRDDGLKMGTLTLWAKHDDETAFNAFKLSEIEKKLQSTTEGAHYDIAKVLREMYDGVYVCGDITHKAWYEFRGHRYVPIQEGYTLFINISVELVEKYNKRVIQLYHEIGYAMEEVPKNEDKIKKMEEDMNKVKGIIKKLKDTPFKNNIMIQARTLFYDEKFNERMNENRNLLVFENGVYDLERTEFRAGRPEDYMTFTTGINYMDYNEMDCDIQRVEHIFSQIHPKKENRDFFFTTLAAGLNGNKREQKLDIWTGSGSNGKSVTVDFLSKSLGEFFDSPSITMLTRKRGSSSAASPDMAKLKGKRVISFLEPEHDDTLHTSILKQFFGGDWIEARGLFKDPIRFKPQSSGFLSCNNLPKIPSTDGGTWRRIRVLKFGSKFVHDPNPSNPNEFRVDTKLIEQIDHLTEAFVSILIHYWKRLKTVHQYVITEPEDVAAVTAEYKRTSDIYLRFVNDMVEDVPESRVSLSSKILYDTFKIWFQHEFSSKPPPKLEAVKEFEARLGKPVARKGWIGKRIREETDEDDGKDDLQ